MKFSVAPLRYIGAAAAVLVAVAGIYMGWSNYEPDYCKIEITASYPLMLKPGLTEKILLLDGLPRAGKMMVGPLASYLVDVDYGHMSLWLDHILILWRLGVL